MHTSKAIAHYMQKVLPIKRASRDFFPEVKSLSKQAKECKSGKIIETSFETKNAITDKEKASAMRRMDNSDVN